MRTLRTADKCEQELLGTATVASEEELIAAHREIAAEGGCHVLDTSISERFHPGAYPEISPLDEIVWEQNQ